MSNEYPVGQAAGQSGQYPAPGYPDDQKPPIQISNLPGILWRRLWLIAAILVLVLAAGVVYLRQATPVYRATNRLFVARLGESKLVGESTDVQALGRGTNYRATQAEIVSSPLVLSKVAERPDIKALKTFEKSGGNIIGTLRAGLNVEIGNDDLMNISFDTPNWSDAAPIANAVADAYIAFCDEYKKTSSGEVLQVLQKEQQKLEDELSERLALLAKFRSETDGLATKDKEGNTVLEGSVTLKQLDSFMAALTQAQIDAIDARANLDFIKTLKSDPKRLRQYMDTQRARGELVVTDPDELRMRQDLMQLYDDRETAAAKLGVNNPRYQDIVDRINNLEQKLTQYDLKFVDNQLSVSTQKLNAAEHRAAELAQYIRANSGDTRKLNAQMAQYDRLQAELQQTRGRLDVVNARIRELDMSQDMRAMNVMLVEAASEPEKPFSPNSSKVLKMCLAFGLILGLTFAVALEVIDDRMRSADQMATVTGLPLLGVIPETISEQGDLGRHLERDPASPMAESIRSCRTAVLFGTPQGKAKTILITSPTPGDGKSTIAASLAESLAQSGKKTILLDADLRKPRVEEIFQIQPEIGLSSLITGQAQLEQAIQHGPVENLDLIPCGPIPPNPAELLNSETFRSLLQTLSGQYDHVVVDTPPVLVVTDARIVATYCDISILVLMAGKCRQRAARQAKESLQAVGARLLGIIANAVPLRRRSGYGGYDYGGYGYGYGYGYNRKEGKDKHKQAVHV